MGQYALSFPFYDSLFLALAVSVTSTVIVMSVRGTRYDKGRIFGSYSECSNN